MIKPSIVHEEEHYLSFLDDVRNRIQGTQIRIVKSANRELIALYWALGQLIEEKARGARVGQVGR